MQLFNASNIEFMPINTNYFDINDIALKDLFQMSKEMQFFYKIILFILISVSKARWIFKLKRINYQKQLSLNAE